MALGLFWRSGPVDGARGRHRTLGAVRGSPTQLAPGAVAQAYSICARARRRHRQNTLASAGVGNR